MGVLVISGVYVLLAGAGGFYKWGCFLWASVEYEPYYLGSVVGPLVFEHSQVAWAAVRQAWGSLKKGRFRAAVR